MTPSIHEKSPHRRNDYIVGLLAGSSTAIAFSLLSFFWLRVQNVEPLLTLAWNRWLFLQLTSHLLHCSFLSCFLAITRPSRFLSLLIGAGMMAIPAKFLTNDTQLWSAITIYGGALGLACSFSFTLLRKHFS